MGKSIKKNFIYNSAYQMTSIIIPIITTPYLTRVLGASGVGEFGYELSIASYFMLCIKLGLNNYGNRIIASTRNDRKIMSQSFWSIYLLQMITSFIFVFLYVLYTICASDNTKISLILLGYVVSAGIDITWFYWGIEAFRYIAVRDFVIKILTTVSIFAFVKNSGDVWIYTTIMSIGTLCSQVLLWINIKKRIDGYRPRLKEVMFHLKPNIVLFIPAIAISLYNTMDKIMLGYMTSTSEVGYYESSEKIIKIPVALVTSLGTVMLPRMSNVYATSNDEREANKLIEKSIVFAMFLATSMGFGMMTISNLFVPLFYGPGFDKCVELFEILLPACVFISFANVIRTQYLIPKKMDKVYLISVFVGAGTNLVFNYIFIPQLQSLGAAIGTLIAESSVCIVQSAVVGKYLPLKKYINKCSPFIITGTLMFVIFRDIKIVSMNNFFALLCKIFIAGIFYIVLISIFIFVINKKHENFYDIRGLLSKIKLPL